MSGSRLDQSKPTSQHEGTQNRRLRILFVFGPTSSAVLLIGGTKRDQWTAWYEAAIPTADNLYDDYLIETGQTTRDLTPRGHET